MHSYKKIIKSFTLVELLVVMAILGILASATTIGYSSFIKKSKRSNDIANAAQWSTSLKAYCANNKININSISGMDIKTYLLNNGFDLRPSDDSYTYIFNRESNDIEVIDIDDIDYSKSNMNDLLEVSDNIYILGEGNNDIEKAVNYVCLGDYSKLITLDDKYINYKNSIINTYSLTNTIFISPSNVIKSNNLDKVSNIFLVAGMSFINYNHDLLNLEFNDEYKLYNKIINFVTSDASEIKNKLNVQCENIISLDNLDSNIKIYDSDNNDITNLSKLNYSFKSEGIYSYLEDKFDSNNKISVTFLNDNDLNNNVLLKEELTNLSIECTISDSIKYESYSKTYTSSSGNSLYKLSIMFIKNMELVGYKEVYYVI